ncbi:MAG: hypothetical protein M1834_004705 [Cirrosporium novae-zelandiae]|nr:MAG: hypothetical protein M1834_004705 [Cirrosporium novae-zelandiae]
MADMKLPIRTQQQYGGGDAKEIFENNVQAESENEIFKNEEGQKRSLEPVIDEACKLLQTKDDTSRFVGLALMRSILDTRQELQHDQETILRCWEAIPAKFLSRLLKAKENDKKSKEEASSMVELAVAILHAFIVLLPSERKEDEKFLGRIQGLMAVLVRRYCCLMKENCSLTELTDHGSPPDTTIQVMQILLTLASAPRGASTILTVQDWSPLIEITPQQPLALDTIKHAFLLGATTDHEVENNQNKLDDIVPSILVAFRGINPTPLFLSLSDILSGTISRSLSPPWLPQLAKVIHEAVPKIGSSGSKAILILSATLIQSYPEASTLLFQSSSSKESSKPLHHLFIKLPIIDIQSSLPSLHDQKKKSISEYQDISKHISASYDILTAFVNHLMESMDKEDENGSGSTLFSSFPPDMILKLRSEIGSTISMTIEYLQDERDAPQLPAPTDQPQRLLLQPPTTPTTTSPQTDFLTISQLQTLYLWLQADDNSTLQTSTTTLIPLFLSLYPTNLPLQHPILLILQILLLDPTSAEIFGTSNGFAILFKDLKTITDAMLLLPADKTEIQPRNQEKESQQALEIIRLLLTYAESGSMGPTPEKNLTAILKLATSPFSSSSSPTTSSHQQQRELCISLAQLAIELLTRAYWGAQKRVWGDVVTMKGVVEGLLRGKAEEGGEGENEVEKGIGEVLQGIEEVRRELAGRGVGVSGA